MSVLLFVFLVYYFVDIKKLKFVAGFAHYSSKIVFPEYYDEDTPVELDLRIEGAPKCAKGDTFCEDFDPYPSEKIQSILEKTSSYREFWGKDDELDVAGRNEDEDTFVCKAMQRTIFPNVAKNTNNKWKYIVNQPEGDFRQGIRIETCRS